jgi:hypothetical protein
MKQHIFAFILLFLFAGCAHNNVWYKPNASTNEFNVDRYDCLQKSQQQSSSAFANQYVGTASSGSVTNSLLFDSCMNAKGWSLQDKNNLQKTNELKAADFEQKKVILSDIMKKFDEKYKAVCAKQEYAPLFVKTSCNVKDITFEQIADNTKITTEQKTIFLKYRTEFEAVGKEHRSYMRKVIVREIHKRWLDYNESTLPEIDKNNLDLLNGVITWGEYNQRRKDLQTRGDAEKKKILQLKK